MGIAFENLKPPKWGGEIPEPIEAEPLELGPNCVVDPPVVLSPMAAVTNPPFRKICREMGAGLVVTEMVRDQGLVDGHEGTLAMVDLRPEEKPVGVQLYGKEPATMATAATVAASMGADLVDVNMGCPMRKVVSSGRGAALLKTPDLVYEIFSAMIDAVDIPVTGKTRVGWEDTDAIEVAEAMEEAGAAALTIHGRTRSEGYEGHVDLAVIRQLVEAVDMAVIGNGDVCDWKSCRRMFATTGCDGVMVARGALGNPWVFREIAADLAGESVPGRPSASVRKSMVMRHVELYVDCFDVEQTCLEIRKHLLWYFRDTPGEQVLRRRLSGLETIADIDDAIDEAIDANRDIEEVGAKSHPRGRDIEGGTSQLGATPSSCEEPGIRG